MNKKIDIYKRPKKKLKIENPKKVSVIIPNYNYEKYIIERIDSVLMQTYPIYEIVILDDCSPDNSVKVINKKIDEIISDIINNNMSLEDKILAVHDYIINNTKYDSDALNNNSKYKSYISYGTLLEGYSTCNGI